MKVGTFEKPSKMVVVQSPVVVAVEVDLASQSEEEVAEESFEEDFVDEEDFEAAVSLIFFSFSPSLESRNRVVVR